MVIRYLKAGKSPKEIAVLIHKSTHAVWKMVERYQHVRVTYAETYPLRYPHRDTPPERILKMANESVQ